MSRLARVILPNREARSNLSCWQRRCLIAFRQLPVEGKNKHATLLEMRYRCCIASGVLPELWCTAVRGACGRADRSSHVTKRDGAYRECSRVAVLRSRLAHRPDFPAH